ncbi:hypothetical protein ABZ379_27825 [Streptomyces canus]|uniref:hypothetical protein n=1 Tax=Streptomyces canus TaxID=58343 RepID=UPI0033CD5EFC
MAHAAIRAALNSPADPPVPAEEERPKKPPPPPLTRQLPTLRDLDMNGVRA